MWCRAGRGREVNVGYEGESHYNDIHVSGDGHHIKFEGAFASIDISLESYFSTIFISILSELSLLYEFPAEPYQIFYWSSPRICTRISSELSYSKQFFLLISPHQNAHWILIKNTLENLITIFSRFSSESSQEADQNALKTQNVLLLLESFQDTFQNPFRILIESSSESSQEAYQCPSVFFRIFFECSSESYEEPIRMLSGWSSKSSKELIKVVSGSSSDSHWTLIRILAGFSLESSQDFLLEPLRILAVPLANLWRFSSDSHWNSLNIISRILIKS